MTIEKHQITDPAFGQFMYEANRIICSDAHQLAYINAHETNG
jgi:hypothetical protein